MTDQDRKSDRDAGGRSVTPAIGYHALRTDVAACRRPRDVIRVAGPDAGSYLQGQLSQDIDALGRTGPAWSFLLQPNGKVTAWLRVTRHGDEEVVLDVDAGFGSAVAERLQRFLIRTKATVEQLEGWSMVSVRGPAVGATDFASSNAELVLPADWPGLPGADLLGREVEIPTGVIEVDDGVYEAVRIECGVPAMGSELTDSTIPGEAGAWLVEHSVSFTKGCYTGQELVARVDSRGNNVPRNLRGVVLEDGSVAPVGSPVLVDGGEVGTITSAAAAPNDPAAASCVALAFVRRAVEPPVAATVLVDGVERSAEVRALPLVG